MKFKNIIYTFAILLIVTILSSYLMRTFSPSAASQIFGGYAELTRGEYLIWACLLAPLYEEAIWRYMPIEILRKVTDFEAIKWPVIIGGGLMFGFWHNGPASIPIQGIAGILFGWVYVENKFSYLSSVIVHSLWNFMLIAGLPYFINN